MTCWGGGYRTICSVPADNHKSFAPVSGATDQMFIRQITSVWSSLFNVRQGFARALQAVSGRNVRIKREPFDLPHRLGSVAQIL
jgi:hypothetical protein